MQPDLGSTEMSLDCLLSPQPQLWPGPQLLQNSCLRHLLDLPVLGHLPKIHLPPRPPAAISVTHQTHRPAGVDSLVPAEHSVSS